MGQRHQLFVIAKVGGKYRCLSAIHHQWLYGFTALRRCKELLLIFQAADNRTPIQQELIWASKQPDSFWKTPLNYHLPESNIPFPYITTCLKLGASFEAAEGYYHSVLIEPFGMDFDGGDNNNGITIIDISQPHSPRYCFVDFIGMESQTEVELMSPLSASTYLWAYYDEGDPKFSELLEGFTPFKLITSSSLNETWPRDEWVDEPEENEGSEALPPQPAESIQTQTLKASAMNRLIEKTLADPEDGLDWMLQTELPAHFFPDLREILIDRAQTLEPSPAVLDLLCSALKGERKISLGAFQKFKAEDLRSLLSKLETDCPIESLDLSGHPSLSEAELKQLLEGITDLNTLYLMNMPQISLQGAIAALYDTRYMLRSFYHPDLFRLPLLNNQKEIKSVSEMFEVLRANHNVNTVTQVLWVGGGTEDFPRLENRRIDLDAIPKGEWRNEITHGRFALEDILLSPAKLVGGLSKFAEYSLSNDSLSLGIAEQGQALAGSLAMTAAAPSGSKYAVGALPSELYSHKGGMWPSKWPDLKMKDLKPGEWAILVTGMFPWEDKGKALEGRSLTKWRYAFITLEPQSEESPDLQKLQIELNPVEEDARQLKKKFKFVDVKTFLETTKVDAAEAQKIWEIWDAVEARYKAIGPCDEQDVYDLLTLFTESGAKASQGSDNDGGLIITGYSSAFVY